MINLIGEIAGHVKYLFQTHQDPELLYHNLSHTQFVVDRSKEIAEHYLITQQQEVELLAAAWFHDTGHLFGKMDNHEEKSTKIMLEFLVPKNINPDTIVNITACIISTQMPSRPTRLIDQILCDADTYHLGTPEFMKTDQLVWDEMEARLHKKIENRVEKSLQFLNSHHFFTSYCQELLSEGKNRNIQILQQKRTRF